MGELYFFQAGEEGISYTVAEEVADFLIKYAPHLIDSYKATMLSVALGLGNWGAYGAMRQHLNMLVDVLELVSKAQRV